MIGSKGAGESIIVLGCTGMLGHKLLQVLSTTRNYSLYGTVRTATNCVAQIPKASKLTIVPSIHAENLDAIAALITEVKPLAVINCIGVIKQLPESNKPIPSIMINSLFPHQLAKITAQAGCRLFHFSTDCVYSGKKGFYSEADPPDPEDLYGKTKALGEISGPGCLTIRSSIIGPELNSHLGLFEWFCSQKGKTVKGYRKAFYTGFTTLAMTEIVLMLIEKFPELSGVWNIASPSISKFDVLGLFNEFLNLGVTIVPDDSFAMDRTLDGSRFVKETGFKSKTWRQMIEQLTRDDAIQQRFFKAGN